jgi:hypothetical protein
MSLVFFFEDLSEGIASTAPPERIKTLTIKLWRPPAVHHAFADRTAAIHLADHIRRACASNRWEIVLPKQEMHGV